MSTDRLNVSANERIDIEDFRFVAGDGTQGSIRQITHDFLLEDSVVDNQDHTGYILSGFAISNPAAKQLQVDRGKAILSQLLNGTVVQGVITTEGDTEKIIDLNSYASGDYDIYIRFEEIQGSNQSRIFWNPTGDGSEYTQSVPTRYNAKWSLRVESGNPGAEWLRIGEVNVNGSLTITDERPFYFEGAMAASNPYKSGWSTDGDGGSNDRNSDRKTYGINNLHKMLAALRQCIEDIKGRGLKRWWDRDISGMNIGFDANPTANQFAVGDANFYLTNPSGTPTINFAPTDFLEYERTFDILELTIGSSKNHTWNSTTFTTENISINNYLSVANGAGEGVQSNFVPISSDGYDLGNDSYRWKTAFLHELNLSDDTDEGVVSNFIPGTDHTYDFGGETDRWQDGYFSGTVKTNTLNLTGAIGGNVASDLLPTGSWDLGSSSYKWIDLWISGTATLEKATITELTVSDTATEGVGSNFVPAANKTYDLGNASYRWGACRVQLLDVSTSDGGSDGCGHLYPATTSAYDLGKEARVWQDIYTERVFASDDEYMWAKLSTQHTISESSWGDILPDEHIQASGLTVESTAHQLKCTAGHEGWYKCDAVWVMDPQGDSYLLSIAAYRNGGKISDAQQDFNIKTGNDEIQVHYTFLARLDATTDYVEVKASHDQALKVILVDDKSHFTAVRCKRTVT